MSENIQITEAAADRIKQQLARRGSGLGLRIGIRDSGCSGYRYDLDYADELGQDDLVFEAHGAKVVISPENLKYFNGTTLDFKREGLNQMFHFNNPNARDECGCGESFNFEETTG